MTQQKLPPLRWDDSLSDSDSTLALTIGEGATAERFEFQGSLAERIRIRLQAEIDWLRAERALAETAAAIYGGEAQAKAHFAKKPQT